MADLAAVLAFVEGSEFRKEAARRLAARVAAEIDLNALLDAGSEYIDQIVGELYATIRAELLADAIADAHQHAQALGLAQLTDEEVGAAVDASLETVLTEALTLIDARYDDLTRAVDRMVADGVALETIQNSLAAGGGAALLAPVVAILTATGAGLIAATERTVMDEAVAASDLEAADAGENPPLYSWETREDDRVCEDVFENSCAPRHGMELTYEEWQAFGEPGSENTICTIFARGAFSNCRCVLRDVSAGGSMPDPVNIADAVAAGKARAELVFPDEEAA